MEREGAPETKSWLELPGALLSLAITAPYIKANSF
jgi:hypothetical protein